MNSDSSHFQIMKICGEVEVAHLLNIGCARGLSTVRITSTPTAIEKSFQYYPAEYLVNCRKWG